MSFHPMHKNYTVDLSPISCYWHLKILTDELAFSLVTVLDRQLPKTNSSKGSASTTNMADPDTLIKVKIILLSKISLDCPFKGTGSGC